MATQIDDLILRTKGEEELRRLQAQLQGVDEGLRRSIRQFGEHDATTRLAAARYQGLSEQIRATEASIVRSGGSVAAVTQSINTLSFSVNDAQQFMYGFDQGIRAISNNIPGLIASAQNLSEIGIKGITTALAGPAGLILGLTTVSTLVPLISTNWGRLQDLWAGGDTSTEAERMERLAKATERTTAETQRLIAYRREQQTLERLRTGEPKEVSKSREAAERVVVEAGFRDVADALVSARNLGGLRGRFTPAEAEAQARRDRQLEAIREDERRGRLLPGFREEVERDFARQTARAEEAARDRERGRAETDISRALNDPERFRGLLNELRGAGGRFAPLAEDLAQTTPEARRAQAFRNRVANVSETLGEALGKVNEAIDKRAKELRKIRIDLDRAIQEVEESDRKYSERESERDARALDQAEQRRDRRAEEDRRAIREATESFAPQAQLQIFEGARGAFADPRRRRAFQAETSERIRRATEANLLERGVTVDEAARLAQQAPRQISEDLQRRSLALQARGLDAIRAGQVLLEQLLGDVARLEARLSQVEQRNARLFRQRQQINGTSQNVGRYP